MRLAHALPLLLLAFSANASVDSDIFGIYGDPSAQTRSMEISSYQIRDFYIMAVKVKPMRGWEGSISLSDRSWSLLGAWLNPTSAINVSGPGGFIVGLGGCSFEGPAYQLVRYQFGWFASVNPPNDTIICLGGTTPSSFHGLPGYSDCDDELIPARLSPAIGNLDAGCLVINPLETVRRESTSWGGVKARF